jgi:hypothetical protein
MIETILSGWHYAGSGYRIVVYAVLLSFAFYFIIALSGVLNRKGKK